MDGTVAAVRDSAAETLGMAMKVIGEKAMLPYVDKLDKIKADKACRLFLYSICPLRKHSFRFACIF